LISNQNHSYHGNLVLGGVNTVGVEAETLLNLLLESLTELPCGCHAEVVDSRGNGSLVGKETGDSALVLHAGAADEGGVVDQTVLGGVTLGLEGTEQSLLGTENLDSGGRVLGQVGQATGVGDETSTNGLTDQSGKVGRDHTHFGDKVGRERLAVLDEGDGALGEKHDVLHVGLGDVLTHRDLGGLDDGAGGAVVVLDNLSKLVQAVVGERGLVADEERAGGELLVVGYNLDELGEVPRVPLADSHGEGVDGLVEVVQGSNGLDDVVVVLLDGELHLASAVGVTETELRAGDIAGLEALEELLGVGANATEQVADHLAGLGSLGLNTRELALDGTSQVPVANAESDLVLLLLAALGQVGLQGGPQVVAHDTFGDLVGVLERLGGALERCERDELDHLAEASQVLVRILNLLQAGTDGVGLQLHGEDGVAHGGLVEEVVDRHCGRFSIVVSGQGCAQISEDARSMEYKSCIGLDPLRKCGGVIVGAGAQFVGQSDFETARKLVELRLFPAILLNHANRIGLPSCGRSLNSSCLRCADRRHT